MNQTPGPSGPGVPKREEATEMTRREGVGMSAQVEREAVITALVELYERLCRSGNRAKTEFEMQQLFFAADGVKQAIDVVRRLG